MATNIPQPTAPKPRRSPPHRKSDGRDGAAKLSSGLSPQRQAFVAALVEERGNITRAALRTLNVSSPESASACGSRLLRDARVHAAFDQACRKLNFGAQNIAQVIVDASVADCVHFDTLGNEHVMPDHKTRLSAVGMAAKLLDMEPRQEEAAKGAKHLHIHGLSRADMLFIRATGRLPGPGEMATDPASSDDKPTSDNK